MSGHDCLTAMRRHFDLPQRGLQDCDGDQLFSAVSEKSGRISSEICWSSCLRSETAFSNAERRERIVMSWDTGSRTDWRASDPLTPSLRWQVSLGSRVSSCWVGAAVVAFVPPLWRKSDRFLLGDSSLLCRSSVVALFFSGRGTLWVSCPMISLAVKARVSSC